MADFEIFNPYTGKFERLAEGGPGSGRYPAGSGLNPKKELPRSPRGVVAKYGREMVRAARAAYVAGKARSTKLTDTLRDVSRQVPNATLAINTKFEVKGVDSISEKGARYYAEDLAKDPSARMEDSVARLGDINRYTTVVPHDKFPETVRAMDARMAAAGFINAGANNYFTEGVAKAPYHGLNVAYKKDGFTMEMQFHTEASMAILKTNHPLYEEARKINIDGPESRARFDSLTAQMAKNWEGFKDPPGSSKVMGGGKKV